MRNMGDELKTTAASMPDFNKRFAAIMDKVLVDDDVQKFLNDHQNELATDAISRGAAKLYEFCHVKEQVQNGEKSFAPGYFPHLVVNNHLIDISYAASPEEVQRIQQRKIKQRIQTIMMPKDIRQATLTEFEPNAERFEALNAALDFIANAKSSQFEPGLYLYGPFGVGKTYLLGAIANELAQRGIKTTLVHFPSFAVEMKSSIGDNSVANKVDEIKKAPVLMIDDIGADSMSSWIRDDVLGVILEYRMQQQLPTFFSSNFSMDQLAEEHLRINQRGDDEPLKAQRLMQRIRFLSRAVPMTGNNRRPQN